MPTALNTTPPARDRGGRPVIWDRASWHAASNGAAANGASGAEHIGAALQWLWAHDLQVVDYLYTPNDVTTCPEISGSVMIEIPAETYGGDVNKRITSDFTWNMQEKPTFTPGAGGYSAERETAAA